MRVRPNMEAGPNNKEEVRATLTSSDNFIGKCRGNIFLP